MNQDLNLNKATIEILERFREPTLKVAKAIERFYKSIQQIELNPLGFNLKSNNWRKLHGLPMRRRIPKRYR